MDGYLWRPLLYWPQTAACKVRHTLPIKLWHILVFKICPSFTDIKMWPHVYILYFTVKSNLQWTPYKLIPVLDTAYSVMKVNTSAAVNVPELTKSIDSRVCSPNGLFLVIMISIVHLLMITASRSDLHLFLYLILMKILWGIRIISISLMRKLSHSATSGVSIWVQPLQLQRTHP